RPSQPRTRPRRKHNSRNAHRKSLVQRTTQPGSQREVFIAGGGERRLRGCSCRCSLSLTTDNGCPILATLLFLSLGWDATKRGCPILTTPLFLSLGWDTTKLTSPALPT